MSFARFALRKTAIEAVRAGTYAKVTDSQMAPIEEYALGKTIPVIMVFTDAAQADIKNKEIFAHDTQSLVFQILISKKTKVPVVNEIGQIIGKEDSWQPVRTDAHGELMLDMLCRDIDLALTNPKNPWSNLFLDMACSIDKRVSTRGASSNQEDRFAAWQVAYEIKMYREPTKDQVKPGSVWERFMTLLESLDDAQSIIPILRRSLDSDPDNPFDVNEHIRQSYGLSEGSAESLLLTDLKPEATPESA